jgi:hypothetical protein
VLKGRSAPENSVIHKLCLGPPKPWYRSRVTKVIPKVATSWVTSFLLPAVISSAEGNIVTNISEKCRLLYHNIKTSGNTYS